MKRILFYFFLLRKVVLLNIYPLFEHKGRFCRLMRLDIENFLIFQPSRLRAKRINRDLLKKIKPQRFLNKDNIKLYAWYIPPTKTKKIILYFHGQAESILTHQNVAKFCIDKGIGLYMLSYRGHYKSGGSASERGVYRDAQSAIEHIKQKGFKEQDIILWGHSLGTAVALETAKHNKISGVILQCPIKNLKSAAIDICNFYYRRIHLILLTTLVKYRIKRLRLISKLDNIAKIKEVNCPILLLHSKSDCIAPFTNSIELASLNSNSHLYISDTGSHWDVKWCLNKVFEFVSTLEYN